MLYYKGYMEKIVQDLVQGVGDIINRLIIEPLDNIMSFAVEGTANAVGAVVAGGGRAVLNGVADMTERAADMTVNIGAVRGDESVSNHQFAAMVPAGMNVGMNGQEHSAGDDFIGHNLQAGHAQSAETFFARA